MYLVIVRISGAFKATIPNGYRLAANSAAASPLEHSCGEFP